MNKVQREHAIDILRRNFRANRKLAAMALDPKRSFYLGQALAYRRMAQRLVGLEQ